MLHVVEIKGHRGGECSLVLDRKDAVLLDSGFEFAAGRTVELVREALGSAALRAVLLSHSHYDHAGGSPALQEAFPEAQVVAHPHAAAVFRKEGARELMRSLNSAAARDAGMVRVADRFDRLRVDREVADGEVLGFGGIAVQAVETPGHTRCSVSWYFPEEQLLYASETTGVAPDYPKILPSFIVSYRDTVRSIQRLRALPLKKLLIPHSGSLSGEEVPAFFQRAEDAANEMKDFVVKCDREGMDPWEICVALKDYYYHQRFSGIQPEAAFDANMEAMVPRLLLELEGGEVAS